MAKQQRYGFSKASLQYKAQAQEMILRYQRFEQTNLKPKKPNYSFYVSTQELGEIVDELKRTNADGLKITNSIRISKLGRTIDEKSMQLVITPIIFESETTLNHSSVSDIFYWTEDLPEIEPPIINIPTSGSTGGTS